jgi:hypothetical protein
VTAANASSLPLRLNLGHQRISRAVLDGAWWPRSWDVAVELPPLVQALSKRYGRIRYVILNIAAWEGRVTRLAVADGVCRMGWFTSMSAALLVATTESGDQIDLLVVPPLVTAAAAATMMAAAADPSDMEHADDLLAASSTRITLPGGQVLPEAVWDNEGGRTRSDAVHHVGPQPETTIV